MKELISSIQQNLAKIDNGNISMLEMEQLVSDTRELNERLIVLRYKAYEQGVLGENDTSADEPIIYQPETDIILNVQLDDEQEETPHEISDFSGLVEPEIDELDLPFEIDLFAVNNDTILEKELEKETEEEVKIIENNTTILTSYDDENGFEEEEITHNETVIIEEENATIIIETEEKTTITTFNEPELEAPSYFAPEQVTSSNNKPTEKEELDSDTFVKIKSIEQSLRSNYSIMSLDTLIGSFTLNERLQFINELFEGSSDSFSTAIKKLDTQENLSDARNIVAEYADNNNWDLESEIVEDFLVKICRRYAADISA